VSDRTSSPPPPRPTTPTTTEDVVGIGCGLVGIAGKLVVASVIGDADAI
jgi:hypothetical protein